MKLRSAIERIVGVVIIDDDLVDACRRSVEVRCAIVDVSKYRKRQAQEALEAEAMLAVVDTFSERTGGHYRVGRTWPDARAIIKGSYALIEIDIGLDYADQGDGIEAVRVDVFRSVPKNGFARFLDGLLTKRQTTLDLTEKVAPPPPPPPAPVRAKSNARSILDGNKR